MAKEWCWQIECKVCLPVELVAAEKEVEAEVRAMALGTADSRLPDRKCC